MELKTIKRVAISAAYRGAGVLNTHLGRLPDVQKKDDIDLVTEADVQSEAVIIETIRNAFPDHTILAEEGGLKKGVTEYLWLIDPLDGTTNFAHQLNVFSISIAFCLRGDIAVGIVLNPVLGELFTAIKGNGAFLNGRPIHVSPTRSVADSLLATGFPYNIRDLLDPITKRFMNCLKSSQGIRRIGSAAIDLCYVACGRFDGFWEQNLKPWDTAAGMLVAKEAGAVVSDFANQQFTPDNHEILATNGHIHREMISLLKIENAQKGFP